MQWSIDGEVNWTAPRRIALALTPALGSAVLLLVAALTMLSRPRAGQEGYEIPVVVLIAGGFIAAHGFHLWLLHRSLDRNDR